MRAAVCGGWFGLEEGDEKVLHNKKAHIGGVLALFFLALFLGGCGGTNRSGLRAGAEPGTCEAIGLGCTDGEASGPALVDSDGDGNPDDTPPEDDDNGGGPPTQPPVTEVPEDPPFVSENAPARGSHDTTAELDTAITTVVMMTAEDIQESFNDGAEQETPGLDESQNGRTDFGEDAENVLEALNALGIEERYYEADNLTLDYLYLGEGGATMTLDVVGVREQRLEYARLGIWNFEDDSDNPHEFEYFTFADNRVTLGSRGSQAGRAIYAAEGDVVAGSSALTLRFFPTGSFVVDFPTGTFQGTLAATLTTDAGNDLTDQEQFNFGATRPSVGNADSAFEIRFNGFVGDRWNNLIGNSAYHFGGSRSNALGGLSDDGTTGGIVIVTTGEFDPWNNLGGAASSQYFAGNFYDDAEVSGSPEELAGWFSLVPKSNTDNRFIRGGFLGKKPERE